MKLATFLLLSLFLSRTTAAQLTPTPDPNSPNLLINCGTISDICYGPDGLLYATNKGKGQVQVYNPQGALVRAWGHIGDKKEDFFEPKRIFVTQDGFVVVEDRGKRRMKKFDTSGKFIAQWDSPASFEVNGFDPSGRSYGFSFPNIGEIDANDPEGAHPVINDRKMVYWPEYLEGDNKGDLFVLDRGVPPHLGLRLRELDPQQKTLWEIPFTKEGADSENQISCHAFHLNSENHLFVLTGQSEWTGNILQRLLIMVLQADHGALMLKLMKTSPGFSSFLFSLTQNTYRQATYLTEYSPVGTVIQKWDLTYLAARSILTDFTLMPDHHVALIAFQGEGIMIATLDHLSALPYPVPTATVAPPVTSREWRFSRQLSESVTIIGASYDPKNQRQYAISSLGDPECLALDAKGNVYAMCPSSGGIYVFNTNAKLVRKFKLGGTGYWNPAIAISGDRLYAIQSFGSKLNVFSLTGKHLKTWDALFPGQIKGIATDGKGHIYLSTGSWVRKYDLNGHLLKEFGGNGQASNQFGEPSGIAISRSGQVYVADTYRNAIKIFSSDGKFIDAWENAGSGADQLHLPHEIALDRNDNVYVTSDKSVLEPIVQVFNSQGTLLGFFGSSSEYFHDRTGDGLFSGAKGIVVGPKNDVYIADSGHKRIEVFRPY